LIVNGWWVASSIDLLLLNVIIPLATGVEVAVVVRLLVYHTIVKGAAGWPTTVVTNARVEANASVSQLIKLTAMGVATTNDCTIGIGVLSQFTSSILAG
jgi:hypothetical protein